MDVIEPGHVYLLRHLEGDGHQLLTFIRRSSAAVDYGDGEHPGTNTQEVLRALINRTEFLHHVLPAVETMDAAWYLRMALFSYEARAWRRKQRQLNGGAAVNPYVERYKDVPFNEQDIETRPVNEAGHIILTDSELSVTGLCS